MAGHEAEESVAQFGPIVSRARPIDARPVAVLRAYAGPRVAWQPPDGPTLVGAEAAATIRANGANRFDAIREQATALFEAIDYEAPPDAPPALTPRLVGGFAFHDDFDGTAPWNGFPAAQFVLPRVQVLETSGETWLRVTESGPDASPELVEQSLEIAVSRLESAPREGGPPPGVESVSRDPDRSEWGDLVQRALDQIGAGELEKVVLAQRLSVLLHGTFRLGDTLERLRSTYPECYGFGIDPGLGACFFGATPEQLIARSGSAVSTVALAGSVGRGGTPVEDDRLADELRSSRKIRHEHDLVVDAIRDQVQSVPARVTVGEASVRKLANVQHLETPIRAELAKPVHVLELLEALHPTPAVGGLPPTVAKRTIEATERFDRGWYAAPVGWFDAEGDGAFAVGIRSGVAHDARATLFAGNGIVADSDPAAEWDELQLKYRPILDQLG